MQWWSELLKWAASDAGQRIVTGVILPFVAVLLAGLIGAAIGRSATKRLVDQRSRELRANAVSALVNAGQSAARWDSLTPAAKEHAEALSSAADIAIRLLPVAGADFAADWAEHQLAEMRTNSVSFSFQADQTLAEYRDRLVKWLHKPTKARKFFAEDLDRWAYDDKRPDALLADQQRWVEEQAAQPAAAPATKGVDVLFGGPAQPGLAEQAKVLTPGGGIDPDDPFAPKK